MTYNPKITLLYCKGNLSMPCLYCFKKKSCTLNHAKDRDTKHFFNNLKYLFSE